MTILVLKPTTIWGDQGTESRIKAGCDNLQNISATGAFTPVSSKIALGLGGLAIALPLVLQYFSVARALVLLSIYLSGPSNPALGAGLRHTGWFRLNNTSWRVRQ